MPLSTRVGPREFLNGKRAVSQGAGRGGASGNQPSRVSRRPDAPNWQAFQSGGADEGTSRSAGELLAWGEESGAEGTPGQSGGKCAPRKELAGSQCNSKSAGSWGTHLGCSCQYSSSSPSASGACRYHEGPAQAYIQGRVVCQLSLCWDRWD